MNHSDRKESAYTVKLGDRGRLVLPSRARKELGLKQGSQLLLTIEEPGVLKLTSTQVAAANCRGLLKDLGRNRSLADELVAERKEAAEHE